MQRNGEVNVLRRLPVFSPGTVFDVGANRGDWTDAAVQSLDLATVHAFEIAPSMARCLKTRFSGTSRVIVNAFGLADRPGDREIDFSEEGDSSGTTMLVDGARVHAQDRATRQTVHVDTGDDYCARNGIEYIDFIKLDVEGAEPFVLAGFKRMLNERRIALVQFEYNSLSIGSRTLLRDYYKLFEGYGFVVGKLWPRGASFGPYDFREENFRGPNYLALHESRTHWRHALEYRPPSHGHA